MNKLFKIELLIVLTVFFTGNMTFAIDDNSSEIKQNITKDEQIINKINFRDICDKAKEHSYDLKIADYNYLISKQGVRAARSEYFPKLNIMAGTEYTKNFRNNDDTTVMSIGDAFINPYTRFQSVLGVNVFYNLFDFGIRNKNLKIAKEDVLIKELETTQTFQELKLTLLDAYTKVLITQNQIEINNKILSLEESNLAMKERLYNSREISKTELNDAKIKVTQIKTKISDLKSIREESVNWLSFYTGEKYDFEKLQAEELKKPDFDILSFQDYTKSTIWKIHEKNIKKKELELTIAKRNYLPKVNAYGRYYLYGSDHSNYGRALGITPSNLSAGASLNIPVFDGFKNSSLIHKTELELKQLQVERDKAIAGLMTRLANMRSNLIYLDEQIAENQKALAELEDKEKSVHRLASKKIISPIEENDVKIELLNQKIECEKNYITQKSITRGIQILTEEY